MNVKSTTQSSPDLDGINKSKVIVVCTSNERYATVLSACLNSLKQNSQDVNVLARLVNVSGDTYDKLAPINPRAKYLREDVQASTRRDIVTDNASHIGWKRLIKRVKNKKSRVGLHDFHSQESAYCSNIKYNTMNMLLRSGFECVVYLDADTIVVNDIAHIAEMMNGYDIGMYIHESEIGKYKTYHQQEYSGWHAGFMVATNTGICKQMYSEIETKVNENIYDIEADEDEFEAVYKMYCDEVKLQLFDKQYKDSGPSFAKDSYMWTGQSEIKACNEQYIREYKRYRAMQ